MIQKQADVETIRLSPFLLEEKEYVDIRYWRWTRNGPRPTKKGIAIHRSEIIHLIRALQKVGAALNGDDARKEAAISGC